MNPFQAPNVGPGGKDFGNREPEKEVLRDVLPKEFFNNCYDPKVVKLLDQEVINEYDPQHSPWIGREKYVVCWWSLENGKAVAWVKDPVRGYSFPTSEIRRYY